MQAQNGAGTFDHAGFYTSNNGGTTMRITSAAGVQTYSNDYGTTFGAGGGLGTYGSIELDNYVGDAGGCAPNVGAMPSRAMPRDVDKSIVK